MTQILIVKTGALGDVLRTTSILPGLAQRYPDCRVTWVTAPGAVDLLRLNPRVAEIVPLETKSTPDLERVTRRLRDATWDRLLSFDDEEPLCRLVSELSTKRLSGAHLAPDGSRRYTPDVGPWFDMGLLSVHGKASADRLKIANQKSHPAIFAEMLAIPMGKPSLELSPEALRFAEGFAARNRLHERGRLIGLNTGAGGRWHSKTLSVERTAEVARRLHEALESKVTFLVLGGPGEVERNGAILRELQGRTAVVDGGCDNPLLEFAALVSRCDVIVTSDSLALHIGLARGVRTVAFFAPTSAAEIEMYGLGEKVISSAPDYCSYKPDTDTSTVTPERIAEAVLRVVGSR